MQAAPGGNTDAFGASLQFVLCLYNKGEVVFLEIRAEKELLFANKANVWLSPHLRSGLIAINLHWSVQIPWAAQAVTR